MTGGVVFGVKLHRNVSRSPSTPPSTSLVSAVSGWTKLRTITTTCSSPWCEVPSSASLAPVTPTAPRVSTHSAAAGATVWATP
uniref:Uncharacterized protein n=1 Tax=Timema douglasi TaxID=61478 RepID=A0A7R8W0G0_TIMDO|nr:unnamed protein product [Timema douglasi]